MGMAMKAIWFVTGYLALVLQVMCIASGLYIVAETAEGNSALTKKVLKRSLIVIVALYVILWMDGLPILQILVGIGSHVSFCPLLRSFPIVEPFSISFVVAFVSVMANHLLWLNYFTTEEILYRHSRHSISHRDFIGFFIFFIWLVPLGFFVSMTMADDLLPSTDANFNNESTCTREGGKGRRLGLCKRLMEFVFGESDKEKILHSIQPGRGKYV